MTITPEEVSDDLVTRLRKLSPTLDMLECEDVLQAADRLEGLEGKLAEARAKGMEEAVIAVRSKRSDPDNDNGLDLAEEAIRARAAKLTGDKK